MDVQIHYDEAANLYELGGVQDGVFIPFTSLPGTTVEARIATVRANEEADRASGASAAAQTAATNRDAELEAAQARIRELEAQGSGQAAT